MKRSLPVSIAIIAVLAAAWFVGDRVSGRSTSGGPAASAGSPTDVLGVEQFMKAVDRPQGVVRVEGVVSSASASDRLLTLIDRREFEECGVTTCAALYLPVRWSGPMPSVTELVRLEGQTMHEGGKLVFVARQVEHVRSP